MKGDMIKVGMIINLEKQEARRLAVSLAAWLRERQVEPVLTEKAAATLAVAGGTLAAEISQIHLILALGGDGTLLNAARLAAPLGIPLVGINLGQLGFLAQIDPNQLYDDLQLLLSDDYEIEERMMLVAEVHRQDVIAHRLHALNDAVVTKGALSRMIGLETLVSGHLVADYAADGLVVASPTGSTAYSLSAGGPIVTPDVDVILLTPVCPHTLTARPFVISPTSVVEVVVHSQADNAMLTVDGQDGVPLHDSDVVRVYRAPFRARLIRLHQQDFFSVLARKIR